MTLSSEKGLTERRIPMNPRWLGRLLLGSAFVVMVTMTARSDGGREHEGHEHEFVQTNLVSDIPGLAATTDSELVNPWGVSHSPTSPFWVSNQVNNTATLYAVTDATQVSKVIINPPAGFVLIPTTAQGPQGPTGQVSNSNASSFLVKNCREDGSATIIPSTLSR